MHNLGENISFSRIYVLKKHRLGGILIVGNSQLAKSLSQNLWF